MISFILSIMIFASDDLHVLRPGEAWTGVISEDDPTVSTATLLSQSYAASVKRGTSCRIEIPAAGMYTVELRSFFFDAYLVLRDADGNVIAEDDDGLPSTHARLAFHADETSYLLDVCALHDKSGPFEVKLSAGRPPAPLLGVALLEARLADSKATIKAREERLGADHPDVGKALNGLGFILHQQEQYEEALTIMERALDIARKHNGAEHPDTAYALDQVAAQLTPLGRAAEAEPLLRESLAIREAWFPPDHVLVGLVLGLLGRSLQAQEKTEESRELCERGLAIVEAELGPTHRLTLGIARTLADARFIQQDLAGARDLFERIVKANMITAPMSIDTADHMDRLVHVLVEQAEFEQARWFAERALKINEIVHGVDHPETANPLHGLALVRQGMGEFEEAKALFERAIRLHESRFGPDHPRTAATVCALGVALLEFGELQEARSCLERALTVHDDTLGEDHHYTGRCAAALAGVLYKLGDYERARQLADRSHRIYEAAFGPDDRRTAMAASMLSSNLKATGEFVRAKEMQARAIQIIEEAHGPDSAQLVTMLTNYAQMVNPFLAREYYERALRICEASLGPEHPRTANTLHDLAVTLRKLGEIQKTKENLERSLRIREATLSPEHATTANNLNSLGFVLLDLGEVEQARELVSRSLQRIAAMESRVAWALTESERLMLAESTNLTLEIYLGILHLVRTKKANREAFEAILAWKGRVLRSLGQSRGQALAALGPDDRRRVESILQLQARISNELFQKEVVSDEAQQKRLARMREERRKLETELNRSLGPSKEATAVTARDVAQVLPADSVLVDFLVLPLLVPARRDGEKMVAWTSRSEPRLLAWVLHAGRNDIEWLDLGPADRVEAATKEFLERLVATRGVAIDDAATTDNGNDQLRTVLWDPLRASIGEAKQVFVSPDSFLGSLPFEVLQGEDGRFLIEDHAFVYLQDAASLVDAGSTEAKGTGPQDLLAVGGVDYKKRADLAWREAAPKPDSSLTELEESTVVASGEPFPSEEAPTALLRAGFRSRWSPLPATREEAYAIADVHEEAFDEASRLVLQRRDATEERIKHELPRHRVLHLATHGFFQPEGLPSMWEQAKGSRGTELVMREEERRLTGYLPGLLSGLVLAGANRADESGAGRDDGFLTAEEISFLDLSNVDLVVLSACESGLGRPQGGEGMLGFRRTFRQAGARTVISSLWKVSDEATNELMQSFYESMWINGKSKLEALRHAQLEMLKLNRIDNDGDGLPSTWGAFVLDGAWK